MPIGVLGELSHVLPPDILSERNSPADSKYQQGCVDYCCEDYLPIAISRFGIAAGIIPGGEPAGSRQISLSLYSARQIQI